jgi:hypothetical protein
MLKKKKCEGKGPQITSKTLEPLIGIQKPDGGKKLKDNRIGNQTTHL